MPAPSPRQQALLATLRDCGDEMSGAGKGAGGGSMSNTLGGAADEGSSSSYCEIDPEQADTLKELLSSVAERVIGNKSPPDRETLIEALASL